MKKTFVYKVTKAALWVLHVFGASAFLLTIMALCGVPMSWWVGVCTALPGWLIIKWLMALCANEIRKSMEVGSQVTYSFVKDGKEESEDCRFHEGGKCTFGDGLPGCAKDEAYQRGFEDGRHRGLLEQELKHGMAAFCDVSCIRIISCEDSSVHYLEFPDGLRLISQKGKYVGWYACGYEGGGKDG